MKNRTIYFLILLIFGLKGFSQTKAISYQAVILNPQTQELPGQDIQSNILVNRTVSIRFTIEGQFGSVEYQEVHSTNTDRFGVINLLIGKGDPLGANSFDDILWDGSSKKLKVEIDFSGGANFEPLGEQNLTFLPQPPSEEVKGKLQELELEQKDIKDDVAQNAAKVGLSEDQIKTLEITSEITEETIENINSNTASLEQVQEQVKKIESDINNISFDGLNSTTKAYIDNLLIAVADPTKLIQAGFSFSQVTGGKTVAQSLADGISVSDLVNSGATASELISAGASVTDIFNAGVSYADLVAGGASVSDLQTAGASTADLVAANASVSGMISAGISVSDLLSANVTVSALLAGNAPVSDLISAGTTVTELIAANATVSAMLTGGVSVSDLIAQSVSVSDLVSGGATVSDLISAGTSTADLVAANASTSDMLSAGITAQELINANETISNLLGGGETTTSLIGLAYQGGVIMFVASDGTGLICSLSDQNSGNTLSWSPGTAASVAVTKDFGTGAANTTAIIDVVGAGTNYAAGAARAHNGGSYSDWFLPSEDEAIYYYTYNSQINSGLNANGGPPLSYSYWTSSSAGTNSPYGRKIVTGTGVFSSNGKTNTSNNRVRAVRAF